jgi:hypothetical protein
MRCVLSVAGGADFHAEIVAGDPTGLDADTTDLRIDPNTTTSPFAGVGSLQINASRGTYLCTATPIDSTHILTAGHCVDLNNDGKSDRRDGIKSITFNLNYGGNLTSQILAKSWDVNPNFTGFNHPSINDDLTVVTLRVPLPTGVPVYALPTSDLAAGTTLTMVGYGRSGDGVNGYTTNASWTVKRTGENNADAFYTQDDAGQPAANEVFRFDFDGPTGNGSMGGPSLGNRIETTLGGGDSGGPSFVLTGADASAASSYTLVGVNTFTQGTNAPKFGSLGGGINLFPYVSWINSIQTGSVLGSGGGGGGPGNGGTGQSFSNSSATDETVLVPPSADSSSGPIQLTEAPGYVGATIAIGSPSAQSGSTGEDQDDVPRMGSFAGNLPATTTTAKRDLLDVALGVSGAADDAEPSDYATTVDQVLRRWSS